MKEASVDKDKVMALSKRYGELDGEISYCYATRFAEVAKTLTADQKQTLLKLRNLDSQVHLQGRLPLLPGHRRCPRSRTRISCSAIRSAAKPASVRERCGAPRRPTPRLRAAEPRGRRWRTACRRSSPATAPAPRCRWNGAARRRGPRATPSSCTTSIPKGKPSGIGLLYNIPADTRSLPKNVKGVGTLGNNSVNGRTEYAPPHSKGPGAKTYVYTVYALSAPVQLDVAAVRGHPRVLLAAMKDSVLASAELRVVYSRPEGLASQGGSPGQQESPLNLLVTEKPKPSHE